MSTYGRHVADMYDAVAKQYDNWAWQNFWRKNEHPIIKEILAADGKVATTLDIGVGTGAYWRLHSSYSQKVVGVDVSIGMLGMLTQSFPEADVACADAANLPFSDSTFDRILITRVLSHVVAIQRVFTEAYRVMKTNSSLIVSDLDPEHDYELIRFTNISRGSGDAALVPHKHSLDMLTEGASIAGFKLERFWRFRFSDLRWKPAPDDLPSLDRSGARHIFYVAFFRKSA